MIFRLLVTSRNPPNKDHRDQVEGPIGEDLQEGIIQQHAVARETAADDHVVALGRELKRSRNSGKQMLKVAVHREHPPTGGRSRPSAMARPTPLGGVRCTGLITIVVARQGFDHFAGAICAPVVHGMISWR